jgi:hypothetical protein
MPKDAVTAVKTMLPADPTNLQEDYIVEETKESEDPESPKIWAYLWSTITTAQKTSIYNYQPFRTSWKEDLSNYQLSSSDRLKVFNSRYARDSRLVNMPGLTLMLTLASLTDTHFWTIKSNQKRTEMLMRSKTVLMKKAK